MSSPHQWLPPQPAFEPSAPAPTPPPSPPSPSSGVRRGLGGLVALLALLATKLKFVLVALKGAKFLTTSATMLVSVAAYAWIWGLPFAIGFVALLFVHELGH